MPDVAKGCTDRVTHETLGYNRRQMTTISYATIAVSGADATGFLQGQLTADLRALAPGDRTLAAWCNPKGRVICVFRLRVTDEGYRLSLPEALAADVERRLTMFRFRSKVDFSVGTATDADLELADGIDAWRLENLQHGIPEVAAAQTEKFTPHMLNLDLLGAVSFDKGCYTGQEVVARTHYRGATRRRMLRFRASAPLQPGDKISDGERDIGEVLNAIDREVLAVVPLDSPADGLTSGDASLERRPLPYLE